MDEEDLKESAGPEGTEPEETQETGSEEGGGKPGPQTLWVTKGSWEKLCVVKREVRGTWTRVVEIFCEQMMASGLVSEEGREEIQAIGKKYGTEIPDDLGWKSSFGIGEPWPTVAGNQAKIAEEAAKLNESVMDLGEIIENHALAMLDIEENRADYEPEEEDEE